MHSLFKQLDIKNRPLKTKANLEKINDFDETYMVRMYY